jgi:NhaP-type Na+/H+ or K+/H+ antiporter
MSNGGLTSWVFGAKYVQPCPHHARHFLNLLAFSAPSWVWWLYLGLDCAGNLTGSRDFWVLVFVSTGVLVFRRFACYAVWTPGCKVSMSEFIQLATFVGRGIWCTQASWRNTWFCTCLFCIASTRVCVQGGSTVAWGEPFHLRNPSWLRNRL